MKKRDIHQVLHTLSYGDAISGEVLALQRVLRELGHNSEIYAINVHPFLKDRARLYQDYPADFMGEMVLHYSLGSPLNKLYADNRRATRSLIYHNLTPAKWFAGVNPKVVRDIEAGVLELPELCRVTDRLIADSEYNAAELKTLGFKAEVLELPLDTAKWDLPPNPGIAALLQREGGIHVVHVGRLAPNKCIEDIIRMFYFLHHKINKQSKLWLVGVDYDTELYSFALKRLVDELYLTDAVQFVGCLSDAEVKALYLNGTAYVCMSEHEGFCVPLVEALHHGLPAIAYSATAVPGTMGAGGILVREKRHAELAELVNEIYVNRGFRERLVKAGHERARHFSLERFKSRVAEVFAA